MDTFKNHTEFKIRFENLFQTRRNEILKFMLETDNEYKKLIHKRTEASMAVKNTLVDTGINLLFEEYSDAIYAQEIYELDAIYKQAFIDSIIVLQNRDSL